MKSKLIISLFQTVKLSLSISLFQKIGFSLPIRNRSPGINFTEVNGIFMSVMSILLNNTRFFRKYFGKG